ncbi:MAG: nitronate monooxygenase [Enhydrobacter sp.]
MSATFDRTQAFCTRFGLGIPILLAPMAGVAAPALSSAIANAGGLGSCGVLLMKPEEIVAWASEVRSRSNGAFQLNIWIPDPAPKRDAAAEAKVRDFLGTWVPAVPAGAADEPLPDFDAQCEAILKAGPPIVSSIMGLYPADFVARLKQRGIAWFAVATTVPEARAAEAAGADAIVAQGMEAGGHRGAFDAAQAERRLVGLFALLPSIVDAARVGDAAGRDHRHAHGVAAALALGASAAQIGTGFLRCPEAGISAAWADAIATTAPEDTMVSRVFSGRPGRSIATRYALAATAPEAPEPAPYPIQRALTAAMRGVATRAGNIDGIQAWAGQASALARAEPADILAQKIWDGARALLA